MTRAEDLFKQIKTKGIESIDSFITDRQREELFLDFKRSSDNGSGKKLSNEDRKNLSKAITGFGNSEGGIIVWGIECSRKSDEGDVASAKFPLVDVKKFAGYIESEISGLSVPPHTKVENHEIFDDSKKSGFVVTYIPQNQGSPLQDIIKKQFYIRAGSSFFPAPYQVIAGMFGKRPQPNVYNMYTMGPAKIGADSEVIETQIGFMLHNEGPGISENLFLNVQIWSAPGPNCIISIADRENWGGSFNFGMFMYLISKAGLRLAPGAETQPLTMTALFKPPFIEDLRIKVTAGCSDGPIYKGELYCSKEKISEIYNTTIPLNGSWDTKTGHEITQSLLGREKD
ncbi:MAG: hypothetical protein ACD_19C00008G0002 [uncultured bacterium]|nr:MAG: hypothetical protein ACD_19C00008G0002 [uncultured bacterium]